MKEIKIFSPATVSNVACGFDILGFALETVGDEMIIRKSSKKGIKIVKSEGFDLPLEVNKNVAGIAALALINKLDIDFGFDIEIYKKIKPGSGVGSSGASAAGVVYGINEILEKPFSKLELIEFAMKGEFLASDAEHADNIAPAIFGGFILVKSIKPLKIIEIPFPKDLFCVILHPQIQIKTSESRSVLPTKVLLTDATYQLSNIASLIHGLHTNDFNLIGSSLKDRLVEPHRSKLIPFFKEVKNLSIKHGALGCSISGSGPSIFSLTKGYESALKIESAISLLYTKKNIDFITYVSKINSKGVSTISVK